MWTVNWDREAVLSVLMDLKIAEDRTVALAQHEEETDEQDGNILQGNVGSCVRMSDNELNVRDLGWESDGAVKDCRCGMYHL